LCPFFCFLSYFIFWLLLWTEQYYPISIPSPKLKIKTKNSAVHSEFKVKNVPYRLKRCEITGFFFLRINNLACFKFGVLSIICLGSQRNKCFTRWFHKLRLVFFFKQSIYFTETVLLTKTMSWKPPLLIQI
jgi:hypothetical protein